MNYPKVTVQIPTYNQSQYLAETLNSVLMQDYPNLEIVVSDDNSSDATEQVVRSFSDSRIRYFRNPSNEGRVGNYRKALYEYSSGEWVVNLDGDDYFTVPDFISTGMKLILQYREQGHPVVFYQAAITVTDEFRNSQVEKKHHLLTGNGQAVFSDYYFGKFRANRFFSHLTTIYNRELAVKAGFYEYNTHTTDFESMMKLSFYGDVILDNRNAGVWRLHDRNATHTAKTGFRKGGSLVFQRLPGYAAVAYGQQYTKKLERAVTRETHILHLELLAEHGTFSSFVKHLLRYQLFYKRIPILILKSFVNMIKERLRPDNGN
ncbi:MAG: glycosyltransferase family 2 protein [Chitinophagales bacterium]|nr:glycosyltransferase family 2 protein [Chitinophagales bacterium]